jgi:hypothetical protein
MRKTRTIVAVTLLATALCADRAVARTAGSSARVESGDVARGFAQRLTTSLRRVVPVVKLEPGRQQGMAPVAWGVDGGGPQVVPHRFVGDAFRFRLPPPVV